MGTREEKEETLAVSQIVFRWLGGALGSDSSVMALNVFADLRPLESRCRPPSARVGDGMGKLRHGGSGSAEAKHWNRGYLREEGGSELLHRSACFNN